MRSDPLKAKLDALTPLRSASIGELTAPLRAALADKSAYVVAKAATIVEERAVEDLVPDLLGAYPRFFHDPPTKPFNDPNCIAKRAIASALAAFEHRDREPFLRGLAWVQMEPVYGGFIDTAGGLRAACAHALVGCDGDRLETLFALVDHLVSDADKTTKVECVRALGDIGGADVELALRLKAMTGEPNPDHRGDVLGQCYASLLALAPERSLPLVRGVLDGSEEAELRLEAAVALAQMRAVGGVAPAVDYLANRATALENGALVYALAASPHPEAADGLIAVLTGGGDVNPIPLIEALGQSRYARDVRERVAAFVAESRSRALARVFAEAFGDELPD